VKQKQQRVAVGLGNGHFISGRQVASAAGCILPRPPPPLQQLLYTARVNAMIKK